MATVAEQGEMTRRNPPSGGGRPGAYLVEARLLRQAPGEWMLVQEFPVEDEPNARGLSSRIKHGRIAAFAPAGQFDSTSAKEENKDGTTVVNVYVCFTGAAAG